MTDINNDPSEASEADAVEQAQAADGGVDDPSDDTDAAAPVTEAARWDADEADVIEQATTVDPAPEEEYPDPDDV